jgi:hypothetical protein
LTAEFGENTITGEIGPVATDSNDAFDVGVADGLGVSGVSYVGPSGSHTVSGCGLAGAETLDESFDPALDPGATGCTLTIDLTISEDPTDAEWTVTIDVVDLEAPVVDPDSVDDITVPTDTGAATAVVTYGLATATDNVDLAPVVTCDPASGTAFDFGTTTVTCTAVDASDNISDPVMFDVTVEDTEPPAITVPDDIEADATNLLGAEVDYVASATDNVEVATFGCDPDSGAQFGLGVTTVGCDAADTSGNTAEDSFEVTVSVAPDGSSVEIILDDIAGQDFDNPGTDNSLSAPLQQAGTLLDDANEKNDVAVCNKTAAFLKHVEIKQKQERIGEEYADQLTDFTDGPYGLRDAIGC